MDEWVEFDAEPEVRTRRAFRPPCLDESSSCVAPANDDTGQWEQTACTPLNSTSSHPSIVNWRAPNGKMEVCTHVGSVSAPVVGEMMLQQAAVERH